MLLKGLDEIGLTLIHDSEIAAFKQIHRRPRRQSPVDVEVQPSAPPATAKPQPEASRAFP